MTESKRCSKCDKDQPLDAYREILNRGTPYRLARCRTCEQEYSREWYLRTKDRYREQRLETAKAWNKANRPRVRVILRRYHFRKVLRRHGLVSA